MSKSKQPNRQVEAPVQPVRRASKFPPFYRVAKPFRKLLESNRALRASFNEVTYLKVAHRLRRAGMPKWAAAQAAFHAAFPMVGLADEPQSPRRFV